MKTCLRLTFFVCLILPFSAVAEKRVRVEAPCTEGSAFTISIPFKLPPKADTVWYRWYFNGRLVNDTARVATRDNRKVSYTIPADSAYGEDVEAYFDYQLNDECCGDDAWTRSPVYVMTFEQPCQPPQASAITGSTTICENTTGLTYSVANVAGTTYNWVLPTGWTQTAGETASSITVTAGTSAVSGNISVTPFKDCEGETQTLAVTVNAASTLTHSDGATSQTVCQNTAITSIVYSLGGSATGSSISWSPSTPAGISYNSSTGTISGTPTGSGTFTYTITTTGSSPCAEVTATGTITVNQASTLTRSTSGGAASQTVCQNTAITSIVYTRGGSATNSSISWSPSTPAGITYTATSGTISGTPTGNGTFTYTITTSGHTAPCTAATATGTITVNQASTLTRSTSGGAASQTVCQNTAITSIVYTLGGSATGTSISWSPSTPAGISYNTGTGTISGTPTGSGTFTYTITTSGHTSPCAAVTATGTITVNQASTLTRSTSGGAASQTVCQNTAITSIVYTRGGSATGTSISWSPSTPAGISYNTGTGTISGTPTGSGTFTYTITTSGHTSPCAAATATGTITVNQPSTLTRSTSGGAASQTVCQNSAITNIVYTRGGSATGSSISWSPSTPAGISYNTGTGTISGTPTGYGTFTYTITTSGHTSPCTAVTATGTITVNQAATLTLTSGANSHRVCTDANNVGLNSYYNIIYTYGGNATGSNLSWQPYDPTVSSTSNSNNKTRTFTYLPNQKGTWNYTITTIGGSCPTTITNTITVEGTLVGKIIGYAVCWADINVGSYQAFAGSTDNYSTFYQWNRTTAWDEEDNVSNWNITTITDNAWTFNPCPEGWRLPTSTEVNGSLSDNCIWNNGGRYPYRAGIFCGTNQGEDCIYPGSMYGCIFLPAGGYRRNTDGNLVSQGTYGYYWTSSVSSSYGQAFSFSSPGYSAHASTSNKANGNYIRCVMQQ